MTKEEIIADERYHTCGRCKWEDIPYICHQCKWGEDTRKDLWELKEDAEESEQMTILEKIKFEEDWLSEVNLTKQNIGIAFAGIRATVLEQTRWIPVSERLPKVGEKVLCQCQANIFEVLKLTVDGWYHDDNHCYMLGFVIAWQPLPQPYAESEDEE